MMNSTAADEIIMINPTNLNGTTRATNEIVMMMVIQNMTALALA